MGLNLAVGCGVDRLAPMGLREGPAPEGHFDVAVERAFAVDPRVAMALAS